MAGNTVPRNYLTQDRMLRLANAAKLCLDNQRRTLRTINEIKDMAIPTIMDALRNKGITPDHAFVPEIKQLCDLFDQLYREAAQLIDPEAMETIVEERKYFEVRYKHNKHARDTMRRIRAQRKPDTANTRIDPNAASVFDLGQTEWFSRSTTSGQFNDEAGLAAARGDNDPVVIPEKSMLSHTPEVQQQDDDPDEVDAILPDEGELASSNKRTATTQFGFKKKETN